MASQKLTQYTKSGYLIVATPVVFSGGIVSQSNFLLIAMNTNRLNREIRKNLSWMIVLGIGMVVLRFGAATLLGNTIVRPLDVIGQRMHDNSEGEVDLTARLNVGGKDEIARLSTNFNRFVENIQSIVQQVSTISSTVASGTLQMTAGMTEMVNTAGSVLKSIQEAIHASGERIEGIGGQSQTQSQDSATMAHVMGDLTSIAEQNAAATEEMAATIRETTRTVEDLSLAAEKLNTLVSRFKV